jgi:fructokinase
MHNIICFGEVLWDIFPAGKQPGGAPMNVAFHLNKQGLNSTLISSIGKDKNGEDLKKYLEEQALGTGFVQHHPYLPTGTVKVTLDKDKQATYTIDKPVAWDEITLTDALISIVKDADAFLFGSLACRNDCSRNTLLTLLNKSKLSIFDMNLRPPHYDAPLLRQLIERCTILKINEEELNYVKELYKFQHTSIQHILLALSKLIHTQTICVTLGDKGAVVLHDQQFYQHGGYKVKTADTVGAGDAFLGSFISGYLNKIPMHSILSHACAAGALVASKEGANPPYTDKDIAAILNSNLT